MNPKERIEMKKTIKAVWRRIVTLFLAGLLTVMPLVLTVGIIIWVAGFLERFVGPQTFFGVALESVGMKYAENKTAAYAIGFLFVLGTIFVLGLIFELGAKRYFEKLIDAVVKRIPLVGSIYGTSRQLVEMFDRHDESEIQSMSAVFCTFGRDGGAGVLALMPSPEKICINGHDYHVVLIPTAPVPFGGGLVFMPAESVTAADISVDGLMSIYVSMGVTAHGIMDAKAKES